VSEPLHGVLVPIVTPFTADGERVDEIELRSTVDRLIDDGVHGLVPCGSTGEFTTLTVEERRRVTEVVCSQADGRVAVVPQTGALVTEEAVALTRHAAECGAAAALVLPPFYLPAPDEGYRAYYASVADATELPLVAYNIPFATGKDFDPATLGALAQEIPSVQYVKESSGDLTRIQVVARELGDDIKVLNGFDNLTLPALGAGAVGSIVGSGNVVARRQVAVYDAFVDGRHQEALDAFGELMPLLLSFLFAPYYPAGIKAALELTGHGAGPTRAPGTPLPAESRQQLQALLEQLGLSAATAAA
jgi:4-hydroxy-tetrahydrodipicolinate synthase